MPCQARSRLTYDSILDAAARILEELGYPALTTNGIAGVAGVAIGAVYNYFPDKETVVAELTRRTLREMLDEVSAAFDGATDLDDKHEAIDRLVRTCMHVLRKRAALVRVLFEQVTFLGELEEVNAFPMELFAIAWNSRAIAAPSIGDQDRAAQAYLYLLIPVGRWVPYAAIVDRPAWLSARQAEDAAVELFKRLLS